MVFMALPVFAALDTGLSEYVTILPAAVTTNGVSLSTTTGSPVDVSPYKGMGTLLVSINAEPFGTTNQTAIVTIQQTNTTSGGWSTVRAVTNNLNAASLTAIPFELGKGGKWIRGVASITNNIRSVGVVLNAFGD